MILSLLQMQGIKTQNHAKRHPSLVLYTRTENNPKRIPARIFIGYYPAVSLANAIKQGEHFNLLRQQGIDPKTHTKEQEKEKEQARQQI